MAQQIIDLEISSPGAAPGAANIKPIESIAFSYGRHSLDHSVWYNGSLMTFLATGEDTLGQFALIEAVARRGNVPPPHIRDLLRIGGRDCRFGRRSHNHGNG